MNIVYSSSDYYFKPTYVSIFSLLKNSKSKHNVFLLSSGVTNDNKIKLKDMVESHGSTFAYIEIEKILEEKASKFGFPMMRGNYSTYARIFLSQLLPDVDDVLLIDSDTLIVGDIADINNFLPVDCLMACRDYVVSNKFSRHEDPNLSSSPYFNMGVLYVNLKNWRNTEVSNYLERSYDKSCNLKIADQSIVNKYLVEKIEGLNLRFNFYTYFHYGFDHKFYEKMNNSTRFMSSNEFESMNRHPVIIHFVGTWYERPWFKTNISPFSAVYKTYWDKCFPQDGLCSTPRLSLRNFIYDYFSLAVFRFFGIKSYFFFRYKFIQLLKG